MPSSYSALNSSAAISDGHAAYLFLLSCKTFLISSIMILISNTSLRIIKLFTSRDNGKVVIMTYYAFPRYYKINVRNKKIKEYHNQT